jgi:hypothetical protein
MLKRIIFFMLVTTSLFAQNRALRVDTLQINDNNIITDNGSYLLIDPYGIPVLISGAGSSYGGLYIDGNKTSGDLLRVINDNDGAVGDSTMRISSRGIIFSAANKVYIDSVGIYQMDATDADTCRFYTDADSTYIYSDNPISMRTNVTVWGTLSAQTVTDRTKYVSEKEAIKILKDINLNLTNDEFTNQDDVFVLPYELRDKQYRDLGKCVSLLLAVAKSQQAEIEKLKKKIK